MSKLIISNKKLHGQVIIPPSKSMAHRAIICAALAKDQSKIYRVDLSDDIIATIEAIKALGATIINSEEYIEITGIGGKILHDNYIIDCNESGSTLRFMIPISMLSSGTKTFTGCGKLGTRPLTPYFDIFDEQKIPYQHESDPLNLTISQQLKPGTFYIKADVSSQFISGLLLTLPLLENDSTINLTTELESAPYVDLTIEMINMFGGRIDNHDYKNFIIKGNQSYKSINYEVEGDYSQAAFYFVAGAIGNEISVLGLKENSQQADAAIIPILQRMNVVFNQENGHIALPSKLVGTIIDAKDCPDIIPILCVAASVAKGTTKIINVSRLRIKECDRVHAIVTELTKLGANIKAQDSEIIIHGVEMLIGGVEVWSHNDHRIAMSLTIAATICKEPIYLIDSNCVSKSYPNFYQDIKSLGGKLN